MATVTLQGNEIQTNGSLPAVGATTPDFLLVNKDLEDITLKHLTGNYSVISVVPSLDTPVCATSTSKFDQLALKYPNVNFVIVSADLPFGMSRFCGAESIKNVTCLSMMRSRNFAKDYGVLIEDGPLEGITARAVIVVDGDHKVVYSQLVNEIAEEPDYDAVEAILP